MRATSDLFVTIFELSLKIRSSSARWRERERWRLVRVRDGTRRRWGEGRAVSDSGDRIGGIISLNLENCENPLWIRCYGARAGQLTMGKLDFAGAKGETEIESQGIKASGNSRGEGQWKPFPFPSAPAGAAFVFVSWENGAIARADSSYRTVGFFRSTGLQIETPASDISTTRIVNLRLLL